MLAIHAKGGLEATLERVFRASGQDIHSLRFEWISQAAGIKYEYVDRKLKATILMPAIEDTAEVSMGVYNHWLGFMLHELGHAWYTNNKAWDDAVEQTKDKFLHGLINGLEDPRIEQAVINQGNNNASNLFQNLINSMTDKQPVEPDDFDNIPYILCIEGRRLNGYRISHPPLLPTSPWRDLLTDALKKAHSAKATVQIVNIATDLYDKLKEAKQSGQQAQQQAEVKQGSGQSEEEGGQGKKQKALGKPTIEVEPNAFIQGQAQKVGLQTKQRPLLVERIVQKIEFY